MSKFAKSMTAIGAVIMALLVCLAVSLTIPPANAADPEPGISTQMSQDGASTIKGGALVGWNGWEYTPEGATVPVKVNFVENEDGTGTWYALTDEGIDGKTSGTVTKDEVGKSIVQVTDGATNLVDNVSYTNLNTSQEYTLVGNLAARFADGSYGIILSVDRKAAAPATQEDEVHIYFDPTGGKNVAAISGQPGETIDDRVIGLTSRPDYTFDGWWTENGTESGEWGEAAATRNENGTYTMLLTQFPDASVTYYAKWVPEGDEPNGDKDDATNGDNDENADKEIKDLGTVTYYNPVDKKVYTRPIANGKAEPVEVKDAKVTIDEESGMPLDAVTSAVKFVPSEPSASVKNVFTSFDADGMWEWTFVAFERLYAGDAVDGSGGDAGEGDNTADEGDDEGDEPAAQSLDEMGNAIMSQADGSLAEVLVALAEGDDASTTTVYSFPEPLSTTTDPSASGALAYWQRSINQGLKANATVADLQHTLTVYTNPAYAATGDKKDELTGNSMFMSASNLALAGLAVGDVILWRNPDGSNPVDAQCTSIADDADDATYKVYTLSLYPTGQYSTGTEDDITNVVVSYEGGQAGSHIGNYGYTEIDGKSYPFELVRFNVAEDGSKTLTYNIYNWTTGKYTTQTVTTPYTDTIGNVYCDDAARPDWKTSPGVAQYTLSYVSTLADLEPAAPTPVPVTITFDALGGTPTPAAMSGNAGETIENQTIESVTREGYTFDGWWSENGTETGDWGTIVSSKNQNDTYNLISAVYPPASVTYYAKWKTPSEVTIAFMSNGTLVKEISGTEGADIADAAVPEAPAREGYTFDGWWTADGTDGEWGTGLTKVDDAYVLPYTTFPAESVTYYAKWLEDKPADEPKTGLVASHEDPDDLAQSIFFMSVEEAAAAAADYAPGNTADGDFGGVSQMGDTIGTVLGVLVLAALISGGVFLIRRVRE